MSKEIYISSTPHETRLAIVENDALAEIYYERENEYSLAGSIYNGKVTRVLPGMQSSFVDIGLERDAFLYITDFMEEAGDSADFEGNSSASDHARPARSEARPEGTRSEGSRSEGARSEGRSDRGGRDRNDRNDRGSKPRATEPTDADLFTEAVASLDPARPAGESERGDRNRRGGRNRGGRDRNGNADGQPRRPREDFRLEAPRTEEAPAEAPILASPTPVETNEELGEGAPGADGSRRWRGRRGRRGNRGGERPQTAAQPVEAPADRPQTGPIYDSYSSEEPASEVFAEENFNLDPSVQTPAPLQSEAETSVEPRREMRGDRGNRDRGGDRNGGRSERGGRGGQQTQPRVPRGFAPSASLYQVEGMEEAAPAYGAEPEIAAPSEPVILPGESLGKYRSGGESPAASVAPPASAPVSDFVAQGWDGGMVLPGETLRPRGPQASVSAPRENRGGDREDRGGRGGRDSRGDGRNRDARGGRDARPNKERTFASVPTRTTEPVALRAEASVEPAPHEGDEVATYLTSPETVPASHLITPLDSTFVPPPPIPEAAQEAAAQEAAAQEASEPEAEYEPTEASASFRVDPVPPSEFRQAAPVLETAAFAEPETAVAESHQEHQADQVADPVIAPAVEADPADLHSVSAELQHAFEATPEPAPQFTSISDTGEMHSEPVDPPEEPEPASLILHESAVVDAAEPVTPFAPHFEPGVGALEEEMLEDDEDAESVPTLHAHTAEDFEQETLEGAADLGTMLDDMAIDQITRTEPAENLDHDLEEDFFEEDQDFDSEELSAGDLNDSEEAEAGLGEGIDELENSEYGSGFEGEHAPTAAEAGSASPDGAREPRREGGRRDDRGRRDGRRGDRDRGRRSGSPSGERDRGFSSPGADRISTDRDASSSSSGRRDTRGGRNSMQTTNLPAISDLLKPGQELLCQIAKEPIAKKGARITSHIALPGRFLVFMPTVSHTGVSRKIESDGERRRLKEILLSEKGEASGGFIVRTAAAGASEEELRSDLRFLLNLWADIKARSESSKSPALIYHDLNLVERVLRDQVTDTFSAIWVDTETEYERVLRFLQRFQPSLIRRVKLYTKETPLFEQFGITEEINKALRAKVWLKSGGSIVINQTEALVAIDINTGKFVGKTARLEDTILKTNLDAIPEIVRQIRLRDLGGIIIIDFIDMDERKNRNKVMAALEEELKSDRAPSKVLQFNDFGLVAITRKRVKQSLERTLSTTCGVCAGTGMTKSPVTVCNDIYIEMRKMHKHLDRGDVMLRVHPEVVKQLKAPATHWLQEMEEMCGKTILVKSDPSLHPEQFDIH